MPLHILITHELYPPDMRGGGEYIVQQIARHLALRGHRVRVLTTGEGPETEDTPGVLVRRLPVSRYRFNLCADEIAAEAKSADLVHTFNYHAAWPSLRAAKRLGKPVVALMLGQFGKVWHDMRGPLVGRAFEAWERWLLRLPYDRTLFLSDFSRDMAIGLGVDASKASTVEPGIAHERFRPAPAKVRRALFVGKLEVRKGILEVLELARAMPELPVQIVGWGPEEERVRGCGLPNVDYLGFDNGPRLAAAFATAELFVFPSHAETFGLVIVEAMAAGCAVVSSVPLPFEGAHVQAGDVPGLVAAVRRLWNDPDAARRMGERNHEMAQRYRWERAAEILDQHYQEVLARR